MATAREVIGTLQSRGVILESDGSGGLRVNGISRLSEQERAALKAHKPDLLKALASTTATTGRKAVAGTYSGYSGIYSQSTDHAHHRQRGRSATVGIWSRSGAGDLRGREWPGVGLAAYPWRDRPSPVRPQQIEKEGDSMSSRYRKRDAGLNPGNYALTLGEIAQELGVSRERARQLENRALAKARAILERHGYRLEDLLEVDYE